MKQQRKSGLARAVLALAVFYAAAAAIPTAVYGLSGAAKPAGTQKVSVPAEAAEAPEPPGFLDGLSLPGSPAEELFTLYDRASGREIVLTAEELLPAAVACEMDLAAPEEALKAQAVACYTLFCRKRAAGETIVCDSGSWQTWTTEQQMEQRWGESFPEHLALLERVTESVRRQLLTWEGEPILAAYCAISAGSTEACANVWQGDLPYLRAVASPGDMFCDGYLSTVVLTPEAFRRAAETFFDGETLDFSGEPVTWLTEIERSPSGYVTSAMLGGKKVSGGELRSAFSLRSACFQLDAEDDGFTFTVRGWGHGVGMSQAGAEFLAKRGAGCREILAYYYPGAELVFSS